MISFLEGKIILKKEKYIVVKTNGVGYKVFLSQKNLLEISEKEEKIKVFCHLDVKENSLNLYGFFNLEELEFFEILEAIRGVGPKAALEISALGGLEKIKERVFSEDEKLFEGIPGIGRKKAMTIILELSGKIKNLSKKKISQQKDEAEDGLVGLGFSRQRAGEALKKVSEKIKDDEERIKEALKILGRN